MTKAWRAAARKYYKRFHWAHEMYMECLGQLGTAEVRLQLVERQLGLASSRAGAYDRLVELLKRGEKLGKTAAQVLEAWHDDGPYGMAHDWEDVAGE